MVGVALIGGSVPVDVELPPLALDEDKPVPSDGLDETGVVWHPIAIPVDDEIGGLRIDHLRVAVVAKDVVDALAIDAELAIGEHPTVAVGERIAPTGNDQSSRVAVGHLPRRHRLRKPPDFDRCPAIGAHDDPRHDDGLSDAKLFGGDRPRCRLMVEAGRGRRERHHCQGDAPASAPWRRAGQRPPSPRSRQQGDCQQERRG